VFGLCAVMSGGVQYNMLPDGSMRVAGKIDDMLAVNAVLAFSRLESLKKQISALPGMVLRCALLLVVLCVVDPSCDATCPQTTRCSWIR
jgi:hypothetical protein